jgi:hypothetical protein
MMKALYIIYCSLYGICGFIILKDLFTYGIGYSLKQGFTNLRIKKTAFLTLALTLLGIISHRVVGFNPDTKSFLTWLLAVILPFICALIFRGKLDSHCKPTWQFTAENLSVYS